MLRVLLLCVLGTTPLLEAKPGRACVKYETYTVMSYGMQSFRDPHSHWYSHRRHRLPNRSTRISIRTRMSVCCDRGYVLDEATSDCVPMCLNCGQNQHCVAPNVCECNVGYRRSVFSVPGLYSGLQCTPIPVTTPIPTTTEANVSEEATTPLDMSTTTTPTTTIATTTSTSTTTSTTTTTTSTPKSTTTTQETATILTEREYTAATEQPCGGLCDVNEQCADGICVCKEGYEVVVRNRTSKCEPRCVPACQHANCVGPNICACWPGYERTDNGSCRAACSEETCIFGECSEIGTCVCLQGFRNSDLGCVWAGDAILSNPDTCECWLKARATEEQCLALCDPAEEQPSTQCINSTLCQYSGTAFACPDGMYTCSVVRIPQPDSTPLSPPSPDRLSPDEDKAAANKMTILIVGFIASILVVGVFTYVWLKHRHRFVRRPHYRHMAGGGEDSADL